MTMADTPFSDEDSSSTSVFDEIGSIQKPAFQEENLVPSGDTFDKFDNDNRVLPVRSYSDEIEQEISDSLDQLSTSQDPVPKINGAEEDDDSDEEVRFRKKVRVGNHYQARIPKYKSDIDETSHCTSPDKLLWNPFAADPEAVVTFLKKIASISKLLIPMGTHLRDDEQALYILQQNDYDIEHTLEIVKADETVISSKMSVWTEEECKGFESGLLSFGKNFYLISKNKVTTRTVGELVQFYYLWKKTERYDLLASRIRTGKKKYALNPGISDLMHRYFGGQRANYTSLPSDVQFIVTDTKKEVAQNNVQY